MEIANMTLEYLKVLLSAPVVTAGVVLVVFRVLKRDIQGLVARIARIKFPGGGELSTLQSEQATEELAQTKKEPPRTATGGPAIPEGLSLTPEQVEALREFLQAERANAALWEYRYLNYYLVRNTQNALDWLVSLNTRTSTALFDSVFLPSIPSTEERQAIINALQAHHLIFLTGDLIEVSPKGREYVQWRGPLPQLGP